MNITWFELLILALASFRLTRLVVYDTITEFLRKPFHKTVVEELPDGSIESFIEIKGNGFRYWIGELISCYWCTGVWVAVFLYSGFVLYPVVFKPFIVIMAISGIAALIETINLKLLDD